MGLHRRKKKESKVVEPVVEAPVVLGLEEDKDALLELLQTLKDLNVRSVGDLENLIANM